MKRLILIIGAAFFCSTALSGGMGYGALSGVGEAISEMAREQQNVEAQKELMRQQYELDLAREKRQILLEHQQAQQRKAQTLQEQQAIASERKKLDDARMNLEISRVDAAHPKWRETVRTAEFSDWLGKQPQAIQDLQRSDRANDAIALLDAYKASQSKKQVKK